MLEYEIGTPFDEELNKRLAGGIQVSDPNRRPLGDMLEEARQEEREAIRAKIQHEIDRCSDDHPSRFGLRVARALIGEKEESDEQAKASQEDAEA